MLAWKRTFQRPVVSFLLLAMGIAVLSMTKWGVISSWVGLILIIIVIAGLAVSVRWQIRPIFLARVTFVLQENREEGVIRGAVQQVSPKRVHDSILTEGQSVDLKLSSRDIAARPHLENLRPGAVLRLDEYEGSNQDSQLSRYWVWKPEKNCEVTYRNP